MKKSLYIYLSSLLGVLLFLILHRILVFTFLLLAGLGYEPFAREVSSLAFLAFEYFTLIIVMMLGAWYGIWVGIYWYEKVYEKGSHPGLVGHLTERYWPKRKSRYNLESKIQAAQKKLESGMWELENLAVKAPASIVSPQPIKKRVARKTAPKKLKA